MKLSICVITMNRALQLQEAIDSCLKCNLPEKTEFVIIDNASTDNTEDIVKKIFSSGNFPWYYEKLETNLGVGGGRNYAFEKSKGEYIYALDDDAVISDDKDFFIKAINILDSNKDVVTLTTQIYDTVWGKDRVEKTGPLITEGLYACKMFCGGSHFLRKEFFKGVPYLPNKYGYEEIPPSLRVMNKGKLNVFCPSLLAIHKPAVNKWDWNDEKTHDLLVNGIATPYAIKVMMYPKVFYLLLRIALEIRMLKDLKNVKNRRTRVKSHIKKIREKYYINRKIKIKTVLCLIKMFGMSVF